MDESIRLILILLFVGAFSGVFYWGGLIMFCNGFYIQYTSSRKSEKPLVVFTHITFVPTLALLLLGIYALYKTFTNELSIWFLIGALIPLIPIIYTAARQKG